MNQKAAVQCGYDDTFKMPAMEYGASTEEQAVRREQEKTKEDMKKRQKEELQKEQQATDKESKATELATKQQFENNLEQAIREKKNKQAAEIKARPNMTKEQMDAVRIIVGVIVSCLRAFFLISGSS